MRDLFERLRAGTEADIQNLVTMQMQETVTLDFKLKADPASGAFEKSDRKTLAAAISGFANSGGGLLVWGVDARKGTDQIDCAQNAVPISDIKRFFSEATTLAGQLVQPKHDGVEFAVVDSATKQGGGYLLMYVERSERRPHRSEAQDQKQYFKRAGDGFFPMEHYDIEDAFSRIGAPKITVRFSEAGNSHGGDTHSYLFNVEVINTSEYIAKFPYIAFRNMHGLGLYQRFYVPPFKLSSDLRSGSLNGGADDVVHPGLNLLAGKLVVLFQRTVVPLGTWWMMDERHQNDGPSFDYLFGGEGMRGESGHWSMDRSQFKPPR